MKIKSLISVFVTSGLLAGCIPTLDIKQYIPQQTGVKKKVEYTRIGTSGMWIKPEDGSFARISSNDKDFPTPFHADCTIGQGGLPDSETIVSGYGTALEKGAKKVSVKVPGMNNPMYGVLMLCEVAESAKGPASRLHLIEAPQKYVDQAKEGKISVVYSVVDTGETGYEATGNRYEAYKLVSKKGYGWILWLSDSIIY